MADDLKNTDSSHKRIVVKVGTRLLTHVTGKLNLSYMEKLVRELANLHNQGYEVILVTSGSIGAGRGKLNITRKYVSIPEKQAIAAVGQGLLIQIYEKLFSEYGLIVGQILITRNDIISRRRYINACNTVLTLLKLGVIPIINENDSVSVEEIKFGDNDRLSALVAGLSDATTLILLTDVDGLYTKNPRKYNDAELLTEVDQINDEIKAGAEESHDSLATGGMITKLQAAQIAVSSGVKMYIANGFDPGNILKIIHGENVGTFFKPNKKILNRKKRWIAYGQISSGSIQIDRGACQAICSDNKSLLPVGVISVSGSFSKGDLITINDPEGNEMGRGLTNFSSEEINLILKLKSSEVADIICRPFAEEVIHRDNLVIY